MSIVTREPGLLTAVSFVGNEPKDARYNEDLDTLSFDELSNLTDSLFDLHGKQLRNPKYIRLARSIFDSAWHREAAQDTVTLPVNEDLHVSYLEIMVDAGLWLSYHAATGQQRSNRVE